MAQRGRKSTSLLSINGGAGVIESLVARKAPEPPREFDRMRKARWRKIVGNLDPDRWSDADLEQLATMIDLEVESKILRAGIRETGSMLEEDGVAYENPALKVLDRVINRIQTIHRALRLTTSARTPASSKIVKPRKGNKPWEGLG